MDMRLKDDRNNATSDPFCELMAMSSAPRNRFKGAEEEKNLHVINFLGTDSDFLVSFVLSVKAQELRIHDFSCLHNAFLGSILPFFGNRGSIDKRKKVSTKERF